jgi:hypothetical protein
VADQQDEKAEGRAPSLKKHYGGETVQIQVPKTWNERQ